MADRQRVDELISEVLSSGKYRQISVDLVRRVSTAELEKGRGWKDTVKAVKNKLHQVGGAYLDPAPNYAKWLGELTALSSERDDPALRAFCREAMRQHASTRERLPILDDFYTRSLAGLGPLHSVLDLACGLNPLAIPWIPLAPGATYTACDIYADLVDFLGQFLAHLGMTGQAQVCDLTQTVPDQPVQLALILKTLPCLEQVDRGIALRLLDGVQAETLLVSFPAQSLGGRKKGMPENYAASFSELLSHRPWKAEKVEFSTEVAFRVTKG